MIFRKNEFRKGDFKKTDLKKTDLKKEVFKKGFIKEFRKGFGRSLERVRKRFKKGGLERA